MTAAAGVRTIIMRPITMNMVAPNGTEIDAALAVVLVAEFPLSDVGPRVTRLEGGIVGP